MELKMLYSISSCYAHKITFLILTIKFETNFIGPKKKSHMRITIEPSENNYFLFIS